MSNIVNLFNKGINSLKSSIFDPAPDIQNATKKTGSNERWQQDPAGFMVSIIKSQHSSYKKEIAVWQSARAAALNTDRPRRKQLTELYDEMMMTDAIIISETNKRTDRILNKTFKITDYSTKKEVKDKTDMFNKAWFYKWAKHTHHYLYYGHSLPYIKSILNGEIKDVDIIPRAHVIPEWNAILTDLTGEKTFSYLDDPFAQYCTPVGEGGWLGLLDAAAPLYILRKHSWASWDQFEEMFGIPIRIAKTASTDSKVRAAINAWLRDLGQAGHALFPMDTELDVKENKQTDAFEVFNQKRKAANEELALLINSQAETSNNSGSRAKAEVVVESTQEQTTLADMRFMYFEINDKLMPIMAQVGYKINPEMDVFQWDNPENLEDKLKIFKGVSEMGFEIDPVQVEETFNVKIIGKKESADTEVTQEDSEPKK
ncbi:MULTISPECIES: DUF935 family protein [unclassified Sphingobacterium]|uniref:phage portal protein family protein n=1 Tax=unclassified Sphingobacterium TaxID=2609468 RepID=UPI0025E2A092|nr:MULTISPECIES: DUF935 family protein [unclassified Sphingobacterium]